MTSLRLASCRAKPGSGHEAKARPSTEERVAGLRSPRVLMHMSSRRGVRRCDAKRLNARTSELLSLNHYS